MNVSFWAGAVLNALEGNVRSSICENLSAAVFRGITPVSQVDGETLQYASK